jgi:hypothetical protein
MLGSDLITAMPQLVDENDFLLQASSPRAVQAQTKPEPLPMIAGIPWGSSVNIGARATPSASASSREARARREAYAKRRSRSG